MIAGIVNDGDEAVVPLSVQRPDGLALSGVRIRCCSGHGVQRFSRAAGTVIEVLSLRFLGARQATLADGRESPIRVFAGTVLWDDEVADVLVHETVEGTLVGMALLWGYQLTLEAVTKGRVSIQKIGV